MCESLVAPPCRYKYEAFTNQNTHFFFFMQSVGVNRESTFTIAKWLNRFPGFLDKNQNERVACLKKKKSGQLWVKASLCLPDKHTSYTDTHTQVQLSVQGLPASTDM